MNRQHVHMRDQKASLVVMERFRKQQALQEGMENFVMVISIWTIAFMVAL